MIKEDNPDVREMQDKIAKLSGKTLVFGNYDNQGNFVIAPPDFERTNFDEQYRSDSYLIDENGIADTYNFENSKMLRRILPPIVGALPSVLDSFERKNIDLADMKFLKVRLTPLFLRPQVNDFRTRV
ncbi:MAG: hypothetical protein AABW51_02150 [Nanoarchaeota archaeon]